MQPRRCFAIAVVAALLVGYSGTGCAQQLTWNNALTFYLDNTEFFNPYRTGETLLGGQVLSYVAAALGPRTEVVAGFHGNHQSGDSRFLSPFRPILGFRYRTDNSLGVIGTLVTEDRHGYLEPLEGTLLDITRPVEYGVQWREQHPTGGGEAFLNWQRLNTSTGREVFDYGLLLHADPLTWLRLEMQGHGLHHGGQLYNAGQRVVNNQVLALGGQVSGRLPLLGASSFRAFQLLSHGDVDSLPTGRLNHGHGTYLRAGFRPGNWLELFAIQWWGRDFVSNEGDANYNSQGSNPGFYHPYRKYQEIGVARLTPIESGLTLDTELRFHRIDDRRSIAIGTSPWEYSYRVMVRAPFSMRLRPPGPPAPPEEP
ncbi:MAG: hypothetical protein ACTHM9_05355 [Gemmatimonadales bacterium]|jgi:hypothetical protein